MISQPQVESANNNGGEDNRIPDFLSGAKRRCSGSCCTTPFSASAKNKGRRGNPADDGMDDLTHAGPVEPVQTVTHLGGKILQSADDE